MFDFFCIGKGQTSIPMITAAIETLKQICISACNKWVAPTFCKMDGERALCEAAKTFGPSTRRLVEKWHARRNIEKDLSDVLEGDMESLTVLMSLYEKLVAAESKFDADIVIDHMKKKIKQMRHTNEKKIIRPFEIYFDDPSLLAAYGRRGVPKSHDGPGIQESLFGRYKHNYTSSLLTLSKKRIDDVLYKHFNFRQMMIHRFVEDFQNGKKDKGIEEAKQRYLSVQGEVNLDSDTEAGNSFEQESAVRKSPRKKKQDKQPFRPAASIQKRKKEQDPDITPAPQKARRALFSQDANMNEAYDRTQGKISPGFTKFSKNKAVRKIQLAKLKKTYNKQIEAENKRIEEEKSRRRQTATIASVGNSDDLETFSDDDFDNDYISTKLAEAGQAVPIEDLLFYDTKEKAKDSAWESLKTILLQSEDLESVAVNRYYEVPKSNAVFGYAATLFNEMKPQEARTRPEKVAFKYAHSKINRETFIFINIETNSPTRRSKQIPFMLQFVASLEHSATKDYEGIFHILPTEKSIQDDVVQRRRIKVEFDLTAITKTIKSIQNLYPFVLEKQSKAHPGETDAMPYDHDIEVSTFVLIRYFYIYIFGQHIIPFFIQS